ncbi:Glycoprotein-n-acetylgalactosamine 3-beta-galactosyltransferase, partial [Globisporangium splendens]
MKKPRSATPDPLTGAVRVLLSKGPYLEEPAASLSCLLVVCKSVRAVALEWLTSDFVVDISQGREQIPVPLRGLQEAETRSQLGVQSLLELLRFRYVVRPQYPVPFQQHALPAHVMASTMQHNAVQLIHRGRGARVLLTRDGRKGWCVHAAEDIPRGTYVGEYTGSVISTQMMQRRFQTDKEHNNMNYVLVLRESVSIPDDDQDGDKYGSGCSFRVVRTIIDATEVGNFTRFINHSCDANLELTAVRVDSYIPQLVLFTQRDMKHGEELTFDYGRSSACTNSDEDARERPRGLLVGCIPSSAAIASRMKSYDEICADATSAAEMRLLDHFKCVNCQAALFCSRDCQVKVWKAHKSECNVIATFRKASAGVSPQEQVSKLLEMLTLSAASKRSSEPKVVGVATSLGMNENDLPGWFFSVNYELESGENQKALYQAALELFSLLRDEECWTRDNDSFPRSSYTNIELPHTLANSDEIRTEFLARDGHLVLFSAWLQHPEPPATQSTPLEDRGFYGIVDSILQISSVRDAIDAFMDSRGA